MNFNLFNSILLAGIIQGLIFGGVVLFSKKYNQKSNIFLALFILCFSVDILQYYIIDTGILNPEQLYYYIYVNWGLLIPPFLLFYVQSILNPVKKNAFISQLINYTPFIIVFFFATLYKILIAIEYKNDFVYSFFYILNTVAEIFAILYMLFVLCISLYRIQRYEKENIGFKLSTISTPLNWLKITLTILLFLSLIWLYLMALVIIGKKNSFYPLWIGMSLLIYWLGHIGIYKFGVTTERKKLRNYSIENKKTYTVIEKQKNEHIAALENLIVVQKKYLDSNLTLEKIAEEMQLSKSHLSKIINTELSIGFVDYVNALRVEEAKGYLINPEFSKYTLESIGLEAGFNSKSAFYTAFKKTTGLTPTEFKKKNSNLS